jgi:hypothetical protein
MRRAYYNQWTFHHGEAALPDVNPDAEQLRMAVYNVPATITAYTSTTSASDLDKNGNEHQKKLFPKK